MDTYVDIQYRNALAEILINGREVKPIQGEKAKMISGITLRYRFDNGNAGFPVITERDLSKIWRTAIAELVAFLHGARTLSDMKAWGCGWWSKWVTKERCEIFGLEEGDLGPGSYGPAWTSFPTAEGKPFNQIKEVIQQIKFRPHLRTHQISPWIPQYTLQHENLRRKVVVAPCHGDLHIQCFPETKQLSVVHKQRSGDMPVGVAFNVIQYAAFAHMVAQVVGYTVYEYVHFISDAHIYESQYAIVEELLSRDPRSLPKISLDTSIKDILDFRPNHFQLSEYNPHPAIKIPTPV